MSVAESSIAPIVQNEFAGRFGIARADINPPSGMVVRTWGSSTHDVADGIHRPLRVTGLVVAGEQSDDTLYFLTIDLLAWMSSVDEDGIRRPLERELGIKPGALILHLSHTHGAPFTDPARSDGPGRALIDRYRAEIVEACGRVLTEARVTMQPAILSWGTGTCRLAYNRDLVDPVTGEILCGLNPHAKADDTLLAGRIVDRRGDVLATLVNYACHPTSLGGGNRLISPDYMGAMCEVVERETGGAICMFLHGADGELTPRRSFEDDVEAADQNGRELGYAAMATLAGLFPAGHRLEFTGREESGAALGRWNLAPSEIDASIVSISDTVALKLRDLPTTGELETALANASSGFETERAQRRLAIREKFGDGDHFDLPILVWRLGRSVMVGAPVEFYSDFQIGLRARHPDISVAVMNICNGYLSYLPPKHAYETDVYPVRIALFAAGGMERALDKASAMIDQVMATTNGNTNGPAE